jgi:hypothetical protein
VILHGGGARVIGTGPMRAITLSPLEIAVTEDSPLGMETYFLGVMPCRVHDEEESMSDK